jgi:hypothetical protein
MSTQQIQPHRGPSFLFGGVLLASAVSGQTVIPHTIRLMQTWQMPSDRAPRARFDFPNFPAYQELVRRITASQKAPALRLSGRAAAGDDMLS